MSFINKLFTFLRNHYYRRLVYAKMILSVSSKIKNKDEYLKEYVSRTKESHIWEFTDGYKIKSTGEDVAAICETNIIEDYTKLSGLTIKPGDIVFDIGAHIGSFSIFAASKGATVYSFEPSPLNYEKLVANIALNGYEGKIFPHNVAITNKVGKSKLFVSETDGGVNSLKESNEGALEIETLTIEKVIEKYSLKSIDFLKIDIEGSEYDVLPNLTQEEFSKIKIIAGEYHIMPSLAGKNYAFLKKLLSPHFKKVFRKDPYYFYAVK